MRTCRFSSNYWSSHLIQSANPLRPKECLVHSLWSQWLHGWPLLHWSFHSSVPYKSSSRRCVYVLQLHVVKDDHPWHSDVLSIYTSNVLMLINMELIRSYQSGGKDSCAIHNLPQLLVESTWKLRALLT